MKKRDTIEVTVEDIKFSNVGLGTYADKEIRIKNALPGQQVEVNVSKVKASYAKGTIENIIKKAAYEIEAPCVHYDACGACSRQTVPYEKQIELKASMVKKLIDQNNIEYNTFEGILPSPMDYHYRNKMEYSFGDATKGGQLNLGMHKKGKFYDVVTTTHCLICPEEFNEILEEVLAFARGTGLNKYHIKMREGYFRHLVVRKGFKTDEILIGLSTTTQGAVDYQPLIDKLVKANENIVGFLHIKNDDFSDTVQGDYEVLYGRDYYYEELLGLKFKVSFYSFFQTNPLGAEVLYSKVLDYLDNSTNVLDLFSGTGTITQIVSKKAKQVLGIELVEDAVQMAKENVQLNNITNCEFLVQDLYKEFDMKDFQPDTIIIDPPRYGIPNKALKRIIQFDVDQIIYVSCNPHTLIENLELLNSKGYQIDKFVCVDMFPQNPHVETVVLLSRVEK